MQLQELALETILSGLGNDPAMKDLFAIAEQSTQQKLANLKRAQDLDGERRERMVQCVTRVYGTPEGKILFDYLIGVAFRRFDNITGLALPAETAIQLHALQDGKRELVNDLVRLLKEGLKITST